MNLGAQRLEEAKELAARGLNEAAVAQLDLLTLEIAEMNREIVRLYCAMNERNEIPAIGLDPSRMRN